MPAIAPEAIAAAICIYEQAGNKCSRQAKKKHLLKTENDTRKCSKPCRQRRLFVSGNTVDGGKNIIVVPYHFPRRNEISRFHNICLNKAKVRQKQQQAYYQKA